MLDVGYAHRPVALGREGMVASAHPAATLAGLEVLKTGGSAADAAVATNAVLTVTQPNMCAVGGDIFCLYYEAATRRVHFLNGAGRSGSRASLEEMERRGMTRLPRVGPASVSVPGCVRGWGMLLERFGTRPLHALLAPAIGCAEGFPTTSLLSQSIRDFVPENPSAEWLRIFTPGGRIPAHGELLVQRDLARTLGDLATEGPDLFYTGRVGRAIAAHMAVEGFLTEDDLARHTGEWGEPLSTTYRGVTVYETPPPTQGLAALLALNLLEGFPLARRRVHSVEHLHLLIEMSKLAYADRDRWIGDPTQAGVPVDALLSKAYATRRRGAFDPSKAQPYVAGDPEGDTTGFVVADGRGNVASVIQSVFNAFGSGVVVPGTGVLLQNRGRHFAYEPGHPAVFGPRKQPFHTLITSMVTRDDRPLAALSTMGGNGQAMFHAQILTNLLDYGMDPQEAIERPRFVIGDVVGLSPLPATELMDTVHLETRVPKRVFTGLARKGHPLKPAPALFTRTGQAHALVFRDGTILGGADPRGDGVALGF
jgi:gamma-glutamyltranspeptidase/glutathione hydrolase